VPAIASEHRRAAKLGEAQLRLPRPRWTLRLRLTVLYGTLFLIAGAILLAITYGLFASSSSATVEFKRGTAVVIGDKPPPPVLGAGVAQVRVRSSFIAGPGPTVRQTIARLNAQQLANVKQLQARAVTALASQRDKQRRSLLTESGIALAIMALVSIGLGWVMAGRALRPLRLMNTRARGISERNLHARLALEPRGDELTELAGTFDALLGRLEAAFESQRRFVANASHELRTPITVSRTVAEVAMSDPQPTVKSLRRAFQRVLVAGEQQERTIEALLTLARSQRGIEVRESLDVAELARQAVVGFSGGHVTITTELGSAPTPGDAALLERMLANLLDNAVEHNVPGGYVTVWTGEELGRTTLRVANSGPPIPPERVLDLLQPFRRLDDRRPADGRGLGLGLSIVKAIADAHGAGLSVVSRPEGGLEVTVAFAHAAGDPVGGPV
jgi:signal transduction histidine kinase